MIYNKEKHELTIFNALTKRTMIYLVVEDYSSAGTQYMSDKKWTQLNSDFHKTSFIFYERPFSLEIRYPNKTTILRP